MTFFQDALYGSRLMLRRPVFTTVIILSLAVGIGAATAVFSVLNAFMLRELPVRDPHELVEFLSRYPGEPRMNRFGWSVYEHYRDRNASFSQIIASGATPLEIAAGSDPTATERVIGECAVGDFFQALGVRPALGRLLGRDDDRVAGDPAVAVLSWSFWQSRLNSDPTIIGRRIAVNGVPVTIVGVTPQEFYGLQLGRTPALWVPAAMERLITRASGPPRIGLQLTGRLKPGVSLAQAQAEMQTLDRYRIEPLATKDPAWLQSRLELEPASAGFASLRDQFGNQLLLLMAVVGVLLLIACLNIATLLAARSSARRQEMSVRVALGAGRLRLLRQLFTEALLLCVAGAALGLALANVGAHALLRALPLDSRTGIRLDDVVLELDGCVLLVAVGVTVVTAVLFGLAPARSAFAPATYATLRCIDSGATTRSRRLFEKTLVVAQVACSVVLGSGAILLVGHVWQLRNTETGFEHDSVLLVRLDAPRTTQPPDQVLARYQQILQRMRAVPGVRAAALAALTPIQHGAASRFVQVEGFNEPADARRRVSLNWVGPQYFETLRTPLLAGRAFTDADERGRPVVIVNQRMARHYFPGMSPLGRRLRLEGRDVYEVVGVVADAKYSSLHEPAPATVYLHAYQGGMRGRISQFAVRTDVSPSLLAGAVRGAIADALPSAATPVITTLRAQVDASIVAERLLGKLSSALGGFGALLVAIGLYGLLAFSIASRTREIGIRMVLGATRGNIAGMVLGSAAILVAAGLVIGVPVALWSRGLAAALIPGLEVGAVMPIAASAALIALVAAVAAYLPARRAAAIQPADALRDW